VGGPGVRRRTGPAGRPARRRHRRSAPFGADRAGAAGQLRRRCVAGAAGVHARRQEDPLRGVAVRGARRPGQTGTVGGPGPVVADRRLLGDRRTGEQGMTAQSTVYVINGPNLGRLGRRQPEVYGSTTHDDLVAMIEREATDLGLKAVVRQSDSEAELLGWIHDAADAGVPVILNAGAFTHTSIALRDACAELRAPLIEVHISNVHAREEFRHHSYLSAVATGVIVGLGVQGYLLALRYLANTGKSA